MFTTVAVKKKLSRSDISITGNTPIFSSESENNGIMGYTDQTPDYYVNDATPLYLIFCDHTRNFCIADMNFCVADNVKILKPKVSLTKRQLLYITSSWKKCIQNKGYARHWGIAKSVHFLLPTNNGAIDFDFMESFISELEAESMSELYAYLMVSELDNYELSDEERQAIDDLENVEWSEYTYKSVFNNIQQGQRLKKSDQIPGNIPFVMAGVTNTGVVNYVSNSVASFPRNSITIDIFGNTFYRDYEFGAGDDTGVYWNSEKEYSRYQMLFFTASMGKSLKNKFSYGNKLRSSQSHDFKFFLPTKENQIDFDFMENLISAIQKLVIKDVVTYSERKIEAAKSIT